MTIDKFLSLPIDQHIRLVQQGYLTLLEDKKKDIKMATFARRASDLGEMRVSLMKRLDAMDRTSEVFFPVNSYVEYVHPMYSQKQKFGVVVAHVDGDCQCWFEGDQFQVRVDPIHLRLRYIRGGYPF